MRRALAGAVSLLVIGSIASPAEAQTTYCAPFAGEIRPNEGPCLAFRSTTFVAARPEAVPWGPGDTFLPIRWSRWTAREAVGTGVWEYPEPDGYVDVKFRVVAGKPRVCRSGVRLFESVRVTAVRRKHRRRIPRSLRQPSFERCKSDTLHFLDRPPEAAATP